ncbi:hypothetical protein BGX30_004964 [Mortierella sp. GBA39]|nr:hypothetical protein BGX30_004964 [Mortierella sp. GBA39]
MDLFSDAPIALGDPDAQQMMSDKVIQSIMKALKDDDDSMVHLLTTDIWEIDFEGSTTSKMVFDINLSTILSQVSPEETVIAFLQHKISTYTKTPVEYNAVKDVLENTLYSNNHVNIHTRLNDILPNDLAEMVRNVMTACNLDHPSYKMWHFSRDVTGVYSRFHVTSYPEYFQARNLKDMFAVALNICKMQPSAASVCVQDHVTKRYEIRFLPLSDLSDHKFDIKVSRRYDQFISYDGTRIKLRALTLYDIQLLKYLIKHFDSDASRSIYQLLASMIMSEKDVKLAHDIGWFSGISLDVFAEARQKIYLLPDETCESDTFRAIKNIIKDHNSLSKGFVRDFKFQSSTSPANIWIAITSLIFALVSVIQFFMGL